MPGAKKNGKCTFTFAYEAGQEVQKVCLSGDFNGWDPAGIRMMRRNGSFRKRMELPHGDFQYEFIVEGRWQPDPEAPKQVPNDMGSVNSVVTL
jgi:1,4-alpha-glucan branching enzyme